MADRYWVGGTAAWDGTAGTKWSTTSGGAGGASVPTSADAVFFTNLSTGTCTISTGNTGAASINCTGFTGTIAGSAAISVAGSVTLVSGMTFTYTGTLTLTSGGFLTTAGKTLANLTLSMTVGAQQNLGDALTLSGTLTLTQGTFTTTASGYAITASSFVISGTGSKSLLLNTSTVSLSSVLTAFNYSGSNLTLTPGASVIRLTGATTTFAGGGLTFNNVSFTSTDPTTASITTIRGNNTFNTLTFTAASNGIKRYAFGGNQTITTLVASGGSVLRRLFLCSGTIGTQRDLTVTTWTTRTDVDFRDIAFNSSRSGTRFGNCGNNTNITFSAAKTVYWNLAGTQNWSATGWATTSGGTPSLNNFPLAQDTAVFNDAGSAGTVTFDYRWNVGTLNMSARTLAMTLASGRDITVYGDWTTGSGVSLGMTATTEFAKVGTQTLISDGGSFYQFLCQSPGTTVVLGDALSVTNSFNVNLGASFDAASYSVTAPSVSCSNAGTFNLGTATWTITGTGNVWLANAGSGITGSAEIILSNTSTSSRNFQGGGKTYGKLTIGGATGTSTLSISSGNTFSEIASTKAVAHTINFPTSTTTVGAFNVRGSAGNIVTITRAVDASIALTKTGGGVVDSNYLSLTNVTVSPADTWYAGVNSTDGGGNTGWIFSKAPGGGNFIAFFM